MKPPRPRTLHLRFALATLSLLLLALTTSAQDPKPTQTPPGGVGVGTSPPGRVSDEERESDGPFRPHEVETRAVITSKPAPAFTDEALDNDAYGTVRLRVILSSKGLVKGISVIKGLPDGLTEKAIAAAGQIRFTPARRYGHAVSQYLVLDYDFFNDEEADRQVKIIEQPRPAYTEAARRNRTAGRVVISAYFRKDGTVESRRVLESLPDGLTEKALEALARIKFVPAEIRGRKVTAARKVEYVFSPDTATPEKP